MKLNNLRIKLDRLSVLINAAANLDIEHIYLPPEVVTDPEFYKDFVSTLELTGKFIIDQLTNTIEGMEVNELYDFIDNLEPWLDSIRPIAQENNTIKITASRCAFERVKMALRGQI